MYLTTIYYAIVTIIIRTIYDVTASSRQVCMVLKPCRDYFYFFRA